MMFVHDFVLIALFSFAGIGLLLWFMATHPQD